MTFDIALRATEILLAVAFLQQSAEHIVWSSDERALFIPRAGLSVLLLLGLATPWVLLALSLHSVIILHRFAGPYNGGSDRMGLLVLYCLSLAQLLPSVAFQKLAFSYLALQLVLSYFISGQVKIINPEWRSGRALQDVFRFSAYPVSEGLRRLADKPRLLWVMSWTVMIFELLLPISLLHEGALLLALGAALLFHLSNAWLFGLNRFVWSWIAAYPSVLWLQTRLLQVI